MTVYFAQQSGSGAVKIGWTINLETRLAALRTASSSEIRLLADIDGDKRTEAYFHNLLCDYRSYGEWFDPSDAVMGLVDRVKQDGVDCIPEEFRAAIYQSPRMARDCSDIVAEAKQWIAEIAKPQPFGENFGGTLKRVANLAGVSPRTLKSIWYEGTKHLTAHAYVSLKECFDARMAQRLRGTDST